jgi:hypothetical protein
MGPHALAFGARVGVGELGKAPMASAAREIKWRPHALAFGAMVGVGDAPTALAARKIEWAPRARIWGQGWGSRLPIRQQCCDLCHLTKSQSKV